MSRSRSASATTSLPKPAALVPDGIGRSTAAVSSLLTSISRVSGGSTSRVDMEYFQMIGMDTGRSGDASSPSPLVGEGRGGGSGSCGMIVPHSPTPTPNPSPQGGGE